MKLKQNDLVKGVFSVNVLENVCCLIFSKIYSSLTHNRWNYRLRTVFATKK